MTFTDVFPKLAVFGLLAAMPAVFAQSTGTSVASPTSNASTPKATVAYILFNLGTLGGNMSTANAINASGQVVGWAEAADGRRHAFLFTGAKLLDLGTLGGNASEANAINASGQVVGSITFDQLTAPKVRQHPSHSFLYSGGKMQDLGDGGVIHGQALAINATGQIVGMPFNAVSYSGGTARNIASLDGHEVMVADFNSMPIALASTPTHANGINDVGQIVGQGLIVRGRMATPAYHAFLYSGSDWQDLGPFGGANSDACAINASGQVVGWSEAPPARLGMTGEFKNGYAFLYEGGTMRFLDNLSDRSGAPYSAAYGINDSGQIVGTIQVSDGSFHAFLYTDGKMEDLNDVVGNAWFAATGLRILTRANGINNSGQIVGAAKDIKGNDAGFLLTPTKASPLPMTSTPLPLHVR